MLIRCNARALAAAAAAAWVLTSGTVSAAPASVVPFTAELRAELDAYLEEAIVRFEVPGAAIAVVHEGEVAHVRGFGVRDLETRAPVGAETRFMIGSLSKPLTALMAATLVDDGVLDWEAPVVDVFPEFALSDPASTARVRLRNLFGHTSGVRRSGDLALFGLRPPPLGLVRAASTLPVLAAPGEVFEYSNVMFAIGGFAAARAAGVAPEDRALRRGYGRLMGERVFDRVGMPRTTLDFERAIHAKDHSESYSYSPLARGWASVLDFERAAARLAPSAGVWSDAADMARFLVVQISHGLNPEGQRVVSSEALLETQRVHIPVPGFPNGGYGLGMGVLESGGVTQLAHDGSTVGFGSRLLAVPALGWGVVVLANRGATRPFLDAVERYVTALVYGETRLPDDDLVARDRAFLATLERAFAETSPVDLDLAAAHAGQYERDVRVSVCGDDLILHTPSGDQPFRALPAEMDRFSSVGPVDTRMLAAFSQRSDGTALLSLGYPNAQGQLQPFVVLTRERHHPSSPGARSVCPRSTPPR
jgi:CubicO group peptidase (beta-lactamase class C family)